MNLLADLGPALYIYVLGVVAMSGMIHGTIGLGFPMIATPLIAIFLDVRLAILITLLPTVSVNVASIWGGFDYFSSLKKYRLLFLATLAGSLLGSLMLATLDPAPFRLVLALLILSYLWTTIRGSQTISWISEGSVPAMLLFGFVAGVSGGITNVMVAVLIVYFLSINMQRNRMVPLLNTCFLIGKVTQILVLSAAGLVNIPLLIQTLPMAALALAMLLLGKKIAKVINAELYKKILYGLLAVLALILMYQFFIDIWQYRDTVSIQAHMNPESHLT